MTDDLMRQLVAAGLTKQQASSVTAETLVQFFMQDDGKSLIQEAQRQVAEMRDIVENLRREYKDLQGQLHGTLGTVATIKEMQEQYGSVTDEKAKNTLALYAALLNLSTKAGADPQQAVENAGYVVYAYLGGQAKREIAPLTEGDKGKRI